MKFRDLFKSKTPKIDGKLKEVTFHMTGGHVIVIEGVTEDQFQYDSVDGQLLRWNLTFDKTEDHRDYPAYIRPSAVEAITWREYNRVV